MKKVITLAFLVCFSLSLSAQLNLENRIKNKVNQRVNKKVDKAIDEALDTAEGKGTEKPKNEKAEPGTASAGGNASSGAASTANEPQKEKLSRYSKFDFVPGDKVLFYDDFSKSRIGEFPDFWLTNGMGETVTLNQHKGQWMQLSKSSRYAPDKKFDLPRDYTIEFDLIMLGPEERVLGSLEIELVKLEKEDENPIAAWRYDKTSVRLYQSWKSSNFIIDDNKTKIHNDYTNNVLYARRGQPMHVAIAVNGTRYRLWIDEQKVFDIPQLLPKDAQRNYIFLETRLAQEDPEYQVYLSNFRVAEGKPDLRKALAADGKFVTRGITFDSGSDQLKPESFGIIREIASVLQEDTSLKVRIVGHTDSDGSADKNLELSKKRAMAIKTALVDSYQIDASRLETDGKGASVPVDKNDTAEGKANNRRAEFIKI